MVDLDPAFRQQLLEIAVGQSVPEVPAHSEQDHLGREPEHGERPRPVWIGRQDRRRFIPTVSPRPPCTLNATEPIELILRHRDLWAELAAAGCLFVTTALECVDDHILAILDKGHTGADAADAVTLLWSAGIEPRPSLLPFTPWTTTSGLADLVDLVVEYHLVGNIDPVHWTIRLLVPDGSLLLGRPSWRPTSTVTTPARSAGDGTPPIL